MTVAAYGATSFSELIRATARWSHRSLPATIVFTNFEVSRYFRVSCLSFFVAIGQAGRQTGPFVQSISSNAPRANMHVFLFLMISGRYTNYEVEPRGEFGVDPRKVR